VTSTSTTSRQIQLGLELLWEALGDYLVVRLGGEQLIQEGIYRFEVSMGAEESESIDIPIVVAAVHRHSQLNDTRHRESDPASSSRRRSHARLA